MPAAKPATKQHSRLPCTAVFLVALLAGLPALRGGFLTGDDRQLVLNSPLVSHPSASRAVELLTLKPHRDLYQPVPLLSFSAEFAAVRLLGMDSGPNGAEAAAWLFHLTNVLIHAINALLVWRLIRGLHEDRRVALVAALLFAAHPLAVEPTAWLNGRMISLSALFCLAALNAFDDWQRKPRPAMAALGLVLVVLAMASKVQVGLPVLMALLLIARGTRPKPAWWGLLAACAAITIAFTLLDLHLTSRASVLAKASETLQGSRIARTLVALGWYFQRFVFPVGLASFHPTERLVTWSNPGVIAGLFTVLVVGVAVGISLRWSRVGAIGLAWFLTTVAATLPLVPSRNVMAAERYVYLPNVGLCLAAAALAVFAYGRLAAKNVRLARGLSVAGVGCLIGLTAMSWHVASFYRDDVANSTRVVALYPQAAGTWTQLAWDYHRAGRYREAIDAAQRDLRNHPQTMVARSNQVIGLCQSQLGDAAGAIQSLRTAVQADPTDARAYFRLGQVCDRSGSIDEAAAAYRRALDRQPDYALAAVALGRLLCRIGRLDDAARLYERVLAENPYDAEATLAMAEAEMAGGRGTAAAARLQRLLSWMPGNWAAWTNLGVCLADTGRAEQAIDAYRRAIGINPQAARATIHLVALLARTGKAAEAYATLDGFTSGNVDRAALWAAHDLLVSQGQLPLALRLWTSALKQEPNAADLAAAYGWTCALGMQWDAARQHATMAMKSGTEPASAIARITLAMASLAGGDPAPAVAWVNAPLSPNQPAYLDLRRCMRQALSIYGEAHPNEPWTYYVVGRLLETEGDTATAAAAMQRFNELCQDAACTGQAKRLGITVAPASQAAAVVQPATAPGR